MYAATGGPNIKWGLGFRKEFFQGGAVGVFPSFSRVAKSGEIWFLPLEIEKTTFFAHNFKIQGGEGPLPPLPTPMNGGPGTTGPSAGEDPETE